MVAAENIADALGAKKSGDGWMARCPAHDDGTPSLSIDVGKRGKPIVRCFGGCTQDQVIDALRGLGLWEPVKERRKPGRPPGTGPRFGAGPDTQAGIHPVLDDGAEIETVWTYRNSASIVLGHVVRYRYPNGGKSIRPYFKTNGSTWFSGAAKSGRPIYGLDRLAERPDAPVLVVEGEKTADAAAARFPHLVTVTSPGGASAASKTDWTPLVGRDLVVWPDHDEPGIGYARDVAKLAIRAAAKSARIVTIPAVFPPGWDLADELPDGVDSASLEAMLEAAPEDEAAGDPDRPEIEVTADIAAMADAAEQAIASRPGPAIYQRAGSLCQICHDGPAPAGMFREAGTTSIGLPTTARLMELASSGAFWVEKGVDRNGEEFVRHVKPPRIAIEAMESRPGWRFPVLLGFVEAPTLRPDGSILDAPGYDSTTGLFLVKPEDGTEFLPVQDRPSRQQAAAALAQLAEPLAEFPFATETDKSAALAMILTGLARHAIRGSVPAFAIDAHVAGTGKTLLGHVAGVILRGRSLPVLTQADEEAEESKRLLAVAMAGDQMILIDNVSRPFGGDAIEAALTSGEVRGRVLGATEMKTAPFRSVVVATGNNISFRGDAARRVVPIQMDARVEDPEERVFQRKDLLGWVRENRGRLVSAGLTVIRGYLKSAQPVLLSSYGSFEDWSRLVRSAIVWCGMPDPCAGRDRIRKTSDPQREALRVVLHSWHTCYQNEGVFLFDVCKSIWNESEKFRDLRNSLSALVPRGEAGLNASSLGYALRKFTGRPVDGMMFIQGVHTKRGVPWSIFGKPKTAGDDMTMVTTPSAWGVLGETITNCEHEYALDKPKVYTAAASSPASPSSPGNGSYPDPDLALSESVLIEAEERAAIMLEGN